MMKNQSNDGAEKRGADSGAAPCSVENVSLKVIEKKLLAALDESDKVAILASKQNLDDLIWAMHRSLAQADWDKVRMERMYELLTGMRQLFSEAFPLNDKLTP